MQHGTLGKIEAVSIFLYFWAALVRHSSTYIIICQISALRYLNRLHNMESNKLTKKVFCDLVELDQQVFKTWATDALKLVYDLRLDPTNDKNVLSVNCKRAIQNKFITTWNTYLQNAMLYPRLRTYRTIKYEYVMEPYCI